MVLIASDTKSSNTLLKICDVFAAKYYLTFSTSITEAILILPRGMRCSNIRRIYLSGSVTEYVESSKYLGHIISNYSKDDLDITLLRPVTYK